MKIAVQPIRHLSRDGASDRRELVVTIPLRTVSESNARGHWKVGHRRHREQRLTTRLVLAGALPADGMMPPQSREDASGPRSGVRVVPWSIRVTLTRLAPSSGLDDDNLRGALKYVRDGVADALGVNDRDPRVTWDYDQRRSKPREWAVEIRLTKG